MGRGPVFSLLQPESPNLYNLTQNSPPEPEFVSSQYLCNYEFKLSNKITIIATPPLVFTVGLPGTELSALHSLSRLYIDFCVLSSVWGMLIQ